MLNIERMRFYPVIFEDLSRMFSAPQAQPVSGYLAEVRELTQGGEVGKGIFEEASQQFLRGVRCGYIKMKRVDRRCRRRVRKLIS